MYKSVYGDDLQKCKQNGEILDFPSFNENLKFRIS